MLHGQGEKNLIASIQTKFAYVIEHLEQEIGEWLLIEYRHASQIVGKDRLMFTNVEKPKDVAELSKLGTAESKSFVEIFRAREIVILDPKAKTPLRHADLEAKRGIVIGGILGDESAKGRTRALVTTRFPEAVARNLGFGQFTIDGAVYMAKLVCEGFRLDEIPVKKGLNVRMSKHHSVYLPYVYPLKNGKPVVHKALIEYLHIELNSKNRR